MAHSSITFMSWVQLPGILTGCFSWLFSLPLAHTGMVPHRSTFSPVPLLTVGHVVWNLDRTIKRTINK